MSSRFHALAFTAVLLAACSASSDPVGAGEADLTTGNKFLSGFGDGSLQEANAYYASNGVPAGYTLTQWKADNLTGQQLVTALYRNTNDLGFWRDMTCSQNVGRGTGGCFVTNYRDEGDKAAGAANVGTVAMNVSAAGITRFYAFAPDGTISPSVALDSEAQKFLPRVCDSCHGGSYDGASPDMGSVFREFEPSLLQKPANVDPATLAAGLFSLNQSARSANEAVRGKAEGGPFLVDHAKTAQNAYIDSIYSQASPPIARGNDDAFHLPQSWNRPNDPNAALIRALWTQVVNPSCMGCHRTILPDWSNYDTFVTLSHFQNDTARLSLLASASDFQHDKVTPYMPHAQLTFQNLQLNGLARATIDSWTAALGGASIIDQIFFPQDCQAGGALTSAQVANLAAYGSAGFPQVGELVVQKRSCATRSNGDDCTPWEQAPCANGSPDADPACRTARGVGVISATTAQLLFTAGNHNTINLATPNQTAESWSVNVSGLPSAASLPSGSPVQVTPTCVRIPLQPQTTSTGAASHDEFRAALVAHFSAESYVDPDPQSPLNPAACNGAPMTIAQAESRFPAGSGLTRLRAGVDLGHARPAGVPPRTSRRRVRCVRHARLHRSVVRHGGGGDVDRVRRDGRPVGDALGRRAPAGARRRRPERQRRAGRLGARGDAVDRRRPHEQLLPHSAAVDLDRLAERRLDGGLRRRSREVLTSSRAAGLPLAGIVRRRPAPRAAAQRGLEEAEARPALFLAPEDGAHRLDVRADIGVARDASDRRLDALREAVLAELHVDADSVIPHARGVAGLIELLREHDHRHAGEDALLDRSQPAVRDHQRRALEQPHLRGPRHRDDVLGQRPELRHVEVARAQDELVTRTAPHRADDRREQLGATTVERRDGPERTQEEPARSVESIPWERVIVIRPPRRVDRRLYVVHVARARPRKIQRTRAEDEMRRIRDLAREEASPHRVAWHATGGGHRVEPFRRRDVVPPDVPQPLRVVTEPIELEVDARAEAFRRQAARETRRDSSVARIREARVDEYVRDGELVRHERRRQRRRRAPDRVDGDERWPEALERCGDLRKKPVLLRAAVRDVSQATLLARPFRERVEPSSREDLRHERHVLEASRSDPRREIIDGQVRDAMAASL